MQHLPSNFIENRGPEGPPKAPNWAKIVIFAEFPHNFRGKMRVQKISEKSWDFGNIHEKTPSGVPPLFTPKSPKISAENQISTHFVRAAFSHRSSRDFLRFLLISGPSGPLKTWFLAGRCCIFQKITFFVSLGDFAFFPDFSQFSVVFFLHFGPLGRARGPWKNRAKNDEFQDP